MSLGSPAGRRADRRRLPAARFLAVAVLVAAMSPALLAPGPAACAASPSHAGLVIDTGHEVVKYCVAIPSDSVSGTQLIQLAADQHELEYRLGFGGKAVCMLDGVGTESGDCFDQFPNFWGYWRAGPNGAWAWSSIGAADTSVESGDLEGWVWGTGQDATTHAAPPATTIDDLCGTGATPPPGGGGSGGGHGGGAGKGSGDGGGGQGGGGDGGGGSGGRQPTGSGPGPGAPQSSAPAHTPGSSSDHSVGHHGAASNSAPGGSSDGAVASSDPVTVSSGGPQPASGAAHTEAALAARTTDPSGVPFGALLALAAAVAFGIGGVLLLRRSGLRGH